MTIWQPDLTGRSGPRYRQIVEALAADIAATQLRPGDRLPAQRDLAWRLKVTVGTVSRAYSEAERRGLVSGEVGRGTFVRESTALPLILSDRDESLPINFSQNLPIPGPEAQRLAETLHALAGSNDLATLLQYQPHIGRMRDREAAAAWLSLSSVAADPARIAIVSGGQHAISTVLEAITEPGDVIATEAMTYPGFKTAAQLRRLKIEPIALDAQGILPDSLEAACRTAPIRCLCFTPNLSNPLGSVIPLDRRLAIVEIARRHDVLLVEDDVYGFLIDRPPCFATLAPERTFLINSLSKSAAAGLRVGYVLSPPAYLDRLTLAIRSSIWMAVPMMAEIASRWIEQGIALNLAEEKRAQARLRLALARQIFSLPVTPDTPDAAYHVWLTLTDAWRASEFATEAARRGVAITEGGAFAIDRTPSVNGVRICLSPPRDMATLERGLRILAGLRSEAPDDLLSVV
jgi:DNA-binding transcriptional MocR family regulator